MAMELGGWVLEEAGNLQPVLIGAVVSVGGVEELGTLSGADGALRGGVHSPDAEGLGPEGGEVWVSKLGMSFVEGGVARLGGGER